MEKVKVNKNELISILKSNRDLHEKEYKEAYEGYKIAVEKALKTKIKEVKSGEDFNLNFFSLTKPISYVKSYNDVIGILEI